jgi:sugar phosphate isomerase/epimerase
VIRISAFADEISPDLGEQIAVLQSLGIRHLDLRSVDGVNVLDLSDAQVRNISGRLQAAGMQIVAIGSPIGKTPIDAPAGEHERKFERALELAHRFQTRFVRVFSFYPPAGVPAPPEEWRDEALARLRTMTDRARAEDIVLLHENEKGIYGDTVGRCVDLLSSISDPHLRAAFDPANFIQCGQEPYPSAYEALRPWLAAVHVKDARPDGQVVAAGDGTARWPEILRHLHADGYQGFLSLEPHLERAGRLGGYSGPERFRHAARALISLLDAEGWQYE